MKKPFILNLVIYIFIYVLTWFNFIIFSYCESRRKVLLEHVHEGYEKEWWDYTEKLWTSHMYSIYKNKCILYTNPKSAFDKILTTVNFIYIYIYIILTMY